MHLQQKDISVDHIRLLGHRDQVRQRLELHLGHRVWAQALLVLFEEELELLQLDFQNFDVLHVPVALLFELINFVSKLKLVFLAVFEVADRAQRPLHSWHELLQPSRVLHDHVAAVDCLLCLFETTCLLLLLHD